MSIKNSISPDNWLPVLFLQQFHLQWRDEAKQQIVTFEKLNTVFPWIFAWDMTEVINQTSK